MATQPTTQTTTSNDPYQFYPAALASLARIQENALTERLRADHVLYDVPFVLREYRMIACALLSVLGQSANFDTVIPALKAQLAKEADILAENAHVRADGKQRWARDWAKATFRN